MALDFGIEPPGVSSKETIGVSSSITVVQIASDIGTNDRQTVKATLRGLGLGRIGRERTLEDSPSIRGMIRRVHHLVKVKAECQISKTSSGPEAKSGKVKARGSKKSATRLQSAPRAMREFGPFKDAGPAREGKEVFAFGLNPGRLVRAHDADHEARQIRDGVPNEAYGTLKKGYMLMTSNPGELTAALIEQTGTAVSEIRKFVEDNSANPKLMARFTPDDHWRIRYLTNRFYTLMFGQTPDVAKEAAKAFVKSSRSYREFVERKPEANITDNDYRRILEKILNSIGDRYYSNLTLCEYERSKNSVTANGVFSLKRSLDFKLGDQFPTIGEKKNRKAELGDLKALVVASRRDCEVELEPQEAEGGDVLNSKIRVSCPLGGGANELTLNIVVPGYTNECHEYDLRDWDHT